MSLFVEQLDIWFAFHAEFGPNGDVRRPGASEAQIAEAEAAIGFELIEPLRELYRYSNGAQDEFEFETYEFLPLGFGFLPLDGLVYWQHTCRDTANTFQRDKFCGVSGIPNHHSAGPFVTRGLPMAIQCGEIGTGAVWWLESGGFVWIARSLADYFAHLIEQMGTGEVRWTESGLKLDGNLSTVTEEQLRAVALAAEYQWPFEEISNVVKADEPTMGTARATVVAVNREQVSVLTEHSTVAKPMEISPGFHPAGSQLRVGDRVHFREEAFLYPLEDRRPEVFYRYPRVSRDD